MPPSDEESGRSDAGATFPVDLTALLEQALTTKMPFGRYEGRALLDLPEAYLTWFARQGFPNGKLGQQLALMHEIKVNGLESLVRGKGARPPRGDFGGR